MKNTGKFLALLTLFACLSCNQSAKTSMHHVTGLTMGTITYNVKYFGSPGNLNEDIDRVLRDFNQALSTYIPSSEISRLNSEGKIRFESQFFYPVLEKSHEVFLATNGAYDPSIGPLVQAWGFGPNKEIPNLSSSQVDSLKEIMGFGKIAYDREGVSVPRNFQLDFSAIAKGYAVDLVAEILDKEQISDYLVEIGGEVRAKGVNEKGASWSLGVEDPLVGKEERRILAVVRLKDRSLATSGNYRNYYVKEGKTFAHIIDPRTGYSSNHSLLSASVFASDCISADAYATAFMVLGLEEASKLVESNADLDAILVYRDQKDDLKTWISDGIRSFVEKNRIQ